MSSATSARSDIYRERLWPTPWLLIALLLFIPAVALMIFPLNPPLAIPLGIIVYLVLALSLILAAPSVTVQNGTLIAGRARIPVSLLGSLEELDADSLRTAIGPGLDARAHLLVRGYIHRGVKIEVIDPADPAPYWIVTARRPRTLIDAINAAR